MLFSIIFEKETMPPENTTPFVDRVYVELAKRHRYDNAAIAVILKAARLLGLSFGIHLAQVRQNADRIMTQQSLLDELTFKLAVERKKSEILRARLAKIAPKSRPRYPPAMRFGIVELMKLAVLTVEKAAREFVVSASALYRWMREARLLPESRTIGRLLKITPPTRRIADDIRHAVQAMHRAGIRGGGMIARMLVREGFRISATSARRIVKEPRVPEPRPPDSHAGRVVSARYPNHVVMADLTEIPALFRILTFHVAVVLDVFSRMPLAARVFWKEPDAEDMIELIKYVISRHGRPKHFVSDQGPQFGAEEFKAFLKSKGIRQRFGAVGKRGSIAIIERAIRTFKEILKLRWFPPLTILERRLAFVLVYYAYLRPHMGLAGATPAEVFFGVRPACLDAHDPPRGLARSTEVDPLFEIAFLDEERTMPACPPTGAGRPFIIPRAA
jgi:transposase InsO family protein